MVKITKLSPLEIYKLLPRKSGCRLCGEDSCMAFAIKLLSLQTNLEKCKPLIEDPSFRENYEKLSKLLKPPVKEIEIGVGDRKVVIGGKHVVHRHELMLKNPTAIAIDVSDDLDKDKIIEKVEFINNFKYEYVGYELKLDLIAVRSVTNDPERFKSTLKIVNEYSKKPIIICSTDPEVIHAGLEVLDKERPLIYTATTKNWIKVLELVRRFKVPVTISSLGKINDLISLVKTFKKYGVSDLCLDPGTIPENLGYTLTIFTLTRWKACEEENEDYGYPLIGTPISIWLSGIEKDMLVFWESMIASMLMIRFADLLIMHSTEAVTYLPLVIQRFNYYSDPRKPSSVKPGLRIVGKPDEYAPVLVTTNFVLTYSLVSSDIEKSKIDAYLLIIDTEGYAVDVSVAAGKFTGEAVAKVIRESGIEGMVKHRTLIIPGKASRIAGEIEDATGWKVVAGPQDSSEIGTFIKTRWQEIVGKGSS